MVHHLILETADIALVSIYYLVFGFLASLGVNRLLDIIDAAEEKYEKSSLVLLGFEIGLHVIVLAVIFYLLRVFIRQIPFPWDGKRGYDHSSLFEIDGGIVLVVVILFFQRRLIEKVGIFQNRVRKELGYGPVPDS